MKMERKARRLLSLLLALLMVVTLLPAPTFAAAEASYDEPKATQDSLDEQLRLVTEVYEKTGDYLAGLQPGIGQVGGEWLVLGLARSQAGLSEESKRAYLTKLRKFIRENCNDKNRLHNNKSTENSRVILALTSLLYNTGYFEGKDLLAGLSDMDYVKKQGINGSIWALIAFDSNGYEIPLLKGEGTQTTREGLIAEILGSQLTDGGFALSGKTGDADITGMALQALAPYYASREDVKDAVDKALDCLSNMQLPNGGYASWGEGNIESNAQVLVGLSALGIDCRTDVRFSKDGNNLLDAILGFALEDGAFSHGAGGSETDLMATEQAYYALTAYYRFLEEKNSLYDMKDVEEGIKIGDANGDGDIAINDALAILKFNIEMQQEIFFKSASECDGVEGIDLNDALMVLKYVIDLVNSFPIESKE